MKNLVLIGFMGTGKTTVSEQLSKMCGMDVLDMDETISQRQNLPIPEIFQQYGEEYFRTLETNLLVELQSKENLVISCGGGTAMREQNVIEMKRNGKVILLTAKPETIYQRIKDCKNRPLLEGKNHVEGIAELMEIRRPKYEAAADITINTDQKSVEEICKEIINKI